MGTQACWPLLLDGCVCHLLCALVDPLVWVALLKSPGSALHGDAARAAQDCVKQHQGSS